ncbi:Dyp-type peroxidase family [Glaciihabitans tibetensis]|uniref:Dyp-type peroxidase family n=1 Tax=Glaciihabitans tibetensis TaxID=1266600 RepID=A0A2T0V9Y4_9MICO|nr:Dyp-type peroxidase [Glaciihabitans tibetensis]PRY66963.1 Dyp-type peroxidase family [Glaciihabitans tibetensis]
MSTAEAITLELADIQNGALHPRPTPYVGVYILLRVDDPRQGRQLLGRLLPVVASASDPAGRDKQAWVTVGISFEGLRVLGVPEQSLRTFPKEFQEGMAARAESLGDVGESAPEHWEAPLGTGDVHIALSALSPDTERLATVVESARETYRDYAGVEVIWRQEVYAQEGEKTSFGFKDGLSNPAVEGSGIPGTNPHEAPVKAGEFLLGYPNEVGEISPTPQPEVLGRNGTFLVVRKLHTRVAAYRQYLRDRAKDRADEELLAAKMVGRWTSGAPLVLSPDADDPALGGDIERSNAFMYEADDPRGIKCPVGAHARRMNPRDASIIGVPRLHRLMRRSTSYGPMLPDGVLEDDGVDRGIIFVAAMARIDRQFEFVKTQWINEGLFFGAPDEKDPLVGPNSGSEQFTIPHKPIRRRLTELPTFVVNRGGEYLFVPSLSALKWISEL